MALEVQVLGPVCVGDGRGELVIGARRQRAVLAALALAPTSIVSTDALTQALWGDDPPDGARGTLQSYVSRLRARLGRDAISSEPGGYRLRLPTDLAAVDALAARGRHLVDHDPASAVACFDEALVRWRGSALGDLADDPWFIPDAVHLDGLRRTLIEDRADALLRGGRGAEALAEVERAAAEHPFRERTQLLLVEALAADGRTVDGLRAADRYRRRLAEETGLRPGPDLAALEHRMLVGDGATASPVTSRSRAAALPRPGSLVGRTEELDALGAAVREARLVTVVGPGGMGKTRLVAELLHRDAPPHAVIELAGISRDDVARALATGVGIRSTLTDPLGVVIESLSVSPVLVVLDNVEHVVASLTPAVRRLLDEAPGVRFLATGRVPLGLPEEHVFALGPLPWDATDAPAVTLYAERVRRGAGGRALDVDELADARELCEILEGIPLAVELAAGRAVALGTAEVLRRRDDILDLCSSDRSRPERHGTLRAVVTWSYDLLTPADQELLDRIGVFEGDLSLEAAEAVASEAGAGSVAGGVGRLVQASLLAALPGGRLRVSDTVRRFARERLQLRPWAAATRTSHAEWVAAMLEAVAGSGTGDPADDATLRTHADDVRSALRTALVDADSALTARLARALSALVVYRPDGGLLAWMRAVADVPALATPAVRAAAARAAYLQGDLDDAAALAAGLDAAVAHHARGVVSLYHGAHDEALDAFGAVADAPDVDVPVRLDALAGLALTRCYAGDDAGARAVADTHRLLAESVGSGTHRAFADYVTGELELAAGDARTAVPLLDAAVRRARSVRADFIVGVASTALLSASVRAGDPRSARVTAIEVLDHWWRTATWPQIWTSVRLAAELLGQSDRPDVALLLLDAADLDGAAPAVVGDDAERIEDIRTRATEIIGVSTAARIAEVASRLSRAQVVQRARQVLVEVTARDAATTSGVGCDAR
jgi:DNA-binding SARP family transcriptional activator/predicted ATPase